MSSDWILVTGANGFLGSRLVRQLVDRGEKVKALVRAGANLDQLKDLPPNQVRLAVGDVRFMDRVFAAMRGCDRLFHAAANFSVNERSRQSIIDDSVEGTAAVLEAARRANIRQIVMTSSVATLGASKEKDPLDETCGFNIDDPNSYAEAKNSAEQLALEKAEAGMPIVLVNPSVIIGPADWKPTPSGAQILRYLRFSPSFRIPTVPGGFSYADVDDVALGHIQAMEKGEVGQRYVLGGDNLTHHEMYALLSDLTGLAEPGGEISRDKAEVAASFEQLKAWWSDSEPLLTKKLIQNYYGKYVFVSSEKAKKELGYQSRPARQAFARACKWYLDNGYLPSRIAKRARLELVSV